MTLDLLDFHILQEFYKLQKNDSTTWKIMKKLFLNGKSKEDSLVKLRIKKMAEKGLFIINGKNVRTYTMILDNVIIRKFRFPGRVSNGIAVKIKNKWEIFEL